MRILTPLDAFPPLLYNPPMATRLVQRWRSSDIIQGTMALLSLGAIVYLAIAGQPIPDVLVGVVMAIIGFYFGTKEHTITP